jgi:hypothetical protein
MLLLGGNIPLQTPHGRIRRFAQGDRVRVARGGWHEAKGRVIEWVADPHPPGYEHCSGTSARYRIEGVPGWTYDWQLERAEETWKETICSLLKRLFK